MRRAGRKRGARFESSEALAEQLAVARSAVELCMDAAPGCRFQRRSSINVLTAWPGRVAQAPRARVDRALLGPAHHIGTRVEKRTVGGSARARRRSELTNRRRRCHAGSRLPAGTSARRFANFQRQRGPADPRISVFCANTPVGNVHDSGQVWCRLSERPGVMGDKSSFKHGEITWGGKTIVRASFSNRPALSLHCPDARVCATRAVHLVLPGEQAKRRPDSWHCCTATQRRLGYSLHESWQVG